MYSVRVCRDFAWSGKQVSTLLDSFVIKAEVFNWSTFHEAKVFVHLTLVAHTRFTVVEVFARCNSDRTECSRQFLRFCFHLSHRALSKAHRRSWHSSTLHAHACFHVQHTLYLGSRAGAFSLYRAHSTHTLHHHIIV